MGTVAGDIHTSAEPVGCLFAAGQHLSYVRPQHLQLALQLQEAAHVHVHLGRQRLQLRQDVYLVHLVHPFQVVTATIPTG